tara:strand:- start:6 stop:893 length:888 start_codon:yes stop_codon:yes gene_type:complete
MALTEEFITANGLQAEQVSAIQSHYDTNVIPTLKQEWDGKANENAEGILGGASKYASQKFGIELDRDQGEKWGDYLVRISDSALSSKTEKLTLKEQELEEKLKNFKGGDELKAKYEQSLLDIDGYKQKVAKLEPLEGLDVKYKQSTETLTKLKREVAYGSVKPNFPDTVNKYEADAKWAEWKRGIEDKYTIELVDGKPIAIDKENEHKKFELSKLIEQDTNITELLKGRQQGGNGAKSADFLDVEGIPFKIPKDASKEQISSLVREHVIKELGSFTHKDFTKKFAELYAKTKKIA